MTETNSKTTGDRELPEIAFNLGTVFTVAAVVFSAWRGDYPVAILLMLCLILSELLAIRRAIGAAK